MIVYKLIGIIIIIDANVCEISFELFVLLLVSGVRFLTFP